MIATLKQDINLYPGINKASSRFGVLMMSKIIGAVIIVLMAYGIMLNKKASESDNTRETAQTEKENLHQQLEQLKHVLSVPDKQAQIKTSQQEIAALIAQLTALSKQKTTLLSGYLTVLSQTREPGIEVNNIFLRKADGKLTFSGAASSAEQVPQMVLRWQKSDYFSDKGIQHWKIKRLAADKPTVQFSVFFE